MNLNYLISCAALGLAFGLSCVAQTAPAPLPTPAVTGPLRAAPPFAYDAGPLGKLELNGAVTGLGLWQENSVRGDESTRAALSNGQVFIQKTEGWWQFYVQAGAYNIPVLGTQFFETGQTLSSFYGPVPVAYVKLAQKNTAILVGSLPTLMGAEAIFTFQNMNIMRGLLWNQENTVNRGIQVSQTMGKLSASLSWNDGFYSNRYSWLSGALTYAAGPHTLTFSGMGNLGQTAFRTMATPVQNNSRMYALIYSYMRGAWIVQPYFQFSDVPANAGAGIVNGASTVGGAVLVDRTFRHGVALAGRFEYLATSGAVADRSVNLLYGPGSSAWSATVTPTVQRGRFFIRGELSLVCARDYAPGFAFGGNGAAASQPRGLVEAGLLF